MSEKFKHSDDGSKNFIGYKEGQTVKSLCIILPQVSGYIKYFENWENTCLSWLKIMMCWINKMEFGTILKESWT